MDQLVLVDEQLFDKVDSLDEQQVKLSQVVERQDWLLLLVVRHKQEVAAILGHRRDLAVLICDGLEVDAISQNSSLRVDVVL